MSDKKWSFISSHLADIEWHEIYRSVNHKHPMAFIEVGSDEFYVVIHNILFSKHSILEPKILYPLPGGLDVVDIHMATLEASLVKVDKQSDFSAWQHWGRAVRNAVWPQYEDYKKKRKVVVSLSECK